jgi:hypothetical protein
MACGRARVGMARAIRFPHEIAPARGQSLATARCQKEKSPKKRTQCVVAALPWALKIWDNFSIAVAGRVPQGGSMLRTALLTVAVAIAGGPAALAQLPPQPPPVQNPMSQGNDQERAACHPDVMRFCRELVKADDQSDVFAILGCLQTNRSKISRPCSEVLSNHGQ